MVLYAEEQAVAGMLSSPLALVSVSYLLSTLCLNVVGELPPHPVGYMINIFKTAISKQSTANQKMSIYNAISKLRPLHRWATPNGLSRLLENTRQRPNKYRRPKLTKNPQKVMQNGTQSPSKAVIHA